MKPLYIFKRYLKIYLTLASFHIKSELSYRTQFLVTAIAGPAYVASVFVIVLAAINAAPNLGGIDRQEALTLFIIFQSSYITGVLVYLQSLRYLLFEGFRAAILDSYLLKPINVQFLATLSYIDVRTIPLFLFFIGAVIWRVIWISPHPFQLLLFSVYWLLGIIISYFSASSFAVTGFFATKAGQVIELFDKTTDFGVYSPHIFPSSLGLLITYVVPLFFMGWIPFRILSGEVTPLNLGLPLVMLLCIVPLNQFLWKKGLESYTSASS